MKLRTPILYLALAPIATLAGWGQDAAMQLPATVTAGNSFNIPTTGSGAAVLTIAGPGGAFRKAVQLGEAVAVSSSDIYNAGLYIAALTSGSTTDAKVLEVVPAAQPGSLSFLARPSRLPVGLHNGITGTAYVFDAYHNLITTPMPVFFQLEGPNSAPQTRTVTSLNGVAWTPMDSAAKEGSARFVAKAGNQTSTHVIDEVPGDPCSLTMGAQPDGKRVNLQTTPIRDCSGNPVPDGTIVTFTETYDGMQSTVDAPIKQGIARAVMPSYNGARISVASGVVAGNEIRWEGGK